MSPYTLTSSDLVWKEWNYNYKITNSSATLYTADTWSLWNTTASAKYTITTTASTGTMWINANRPRPVLTPEQLAARAEREEANRRVAEEERKRTEVVRTRARKLLVDNLDDVQRAELARDGRFHVVSNLGNRFMIQMGRAHNVFQIDAEGRRIMEFCGHVGEHVPNEDNVLAQKFLLECDEQAFRSIANAWALTDVGRGARVLVEQAA